MVGILVGILLLGFLIATHELGHLLMAKLFKVSVPEFSIGMGPKLFGHKWGSTTYSLRLIPLGGFCALEGEDGTSDDPAAFCNKTCLEKGLILIAGPLFNILTAVILAVVLVFCAGANTPYVYGTSDLIESGIQKGDVIVSMNGHDINTGLDISAVLLSYGLPEENTVVFYRDGELLQTVYQTTYERPMLGITYSASSSQAEVRVTEGSAADEAGLQSGDIITVVNGMEVSSGEAMRDLFDQMELEDGSVVDLTVSRDGEPVELSVTVRMTSGQHLGFSATGFRDKTQSTLMKLRYSMSEVISWEKYTLASVKSLVTGQTKVSDMSGPVGIISVVSDVVEDEEVASVGAKVIELVNLMVLLAVNVGIMNLMPIPALDGGRLVFVIIEAIRRKRVKPEIEATIHSVGLGLLMLLMGFIMIQDALRLF